VITRLGLLLSPLRVALVLADAFLEKFGADCLTDIRAAHAAYLARISRM